MRLRVGDGVQHVPLVAAIGVDQAAVGRRVAAQHERALLGRAVARPDDGGASEQPAVAAGHHVVGGHPDVGDLGVLQRPGTPPSAPASRMDHPTLNPLFSSAHRSADGRRAARPSYVRRMATILAHLRVKPGMEARFEEIARRLWSATHDHETGVRHYQYWRGADERTYYTLLAFDDHRTFIRHQTSEHHEAAVARPGGGVRVAAAGVGRPDRRGVGPAPHRAPARPGRRRRADGRLHRPLRRRRRPLVDPPPLTPLVPPVPSRATGSQAFSVVTSGPFPPEEPWPARVLATVQAEMGSDMTPENA